VRERFANVFHIEIAVFISNLRVPLHAGRRFQVSQTCSAWFHTLPVQAHLGGSQAVVFFMYNSVYKSLLSINVHRSEITIIFLSVADQKLFFFYPDPEWQVVTHPDSFFQIPDPYR